MNSYARSIGLVVMLALAGLAPTALATVPTATSRNDLAGSGSVKVFSFTFPVSDASWVQVQLAGVAQSSGYIVALNPSQISAPGGTVTFTNAPISGAQVRIQRVVPFTQTTSYSPYAAFPAKVHEATVDRLAMGLQQVDRDRADLAAKGATNYATLGNAVAAINQGSHAVTDSSSLLAFGSTWPRSLTMRAADEANVKDEHALCDGVSDDSAALAAASARASSASVVLVIGCKVKVTSGSASISAPIRFEGSGALDVSTGTGSVTISGPLSAPLGRIFFLGTGTLNFQAQVQQVYPQWFGAVADAYQPPGGTMGGSDNTPAFQAAIDAASAVHRPVYMPGGNYWLNSTLDLTGDAGLQHNGAVLAGAGTESTRLYFSAAAGTGIEFQGSDAIVLRDFAVRGSPTVGIMTGRAIGREWGGNHYFERVLVMIGTNPSANDGLGSIGFLNIEGEEGKYHGIELWADTPLIIAPPNNISIHTFDTATGERLAPRITTYTPKKRPITTALVSNTVYHFSGGCRLISWTFDQPCASLVSAANIDFGNTFFQKRQPVGYGSALNPFAIDTNNVWGLVATGTQEHGTGEPGTSMGSLVVGGTLENARVNVIAGYKSGSNTNNIPVLYIFNSLGIIHNSDLTFRTGGSDQTLIRYDSGGIGVTFSMQNVEIKTDGTGTIATLPQEIFFNAASTRVSFGKVTQGLPQFLQAVSRYRRIVPASKSGIALNTPVKVATITLPPAVGVPDSVTSGTLRFTGTLFVGRTIGQLQAAVSAGEFTVAWFRRYDGTGLTTSATYNRWDTALTTSSTEVDQSAPTITFVHAGEAAFDVMLQVNATGSLVPPIDALLSGSFELNASYGNGSKTADIATF
jgi:hypothetical protein